MLHTFHRGDDLVFIAYVFPNLRVIRILPHWMGYFLPLSVLDSIRDIEGVVYLELSFSLIGEIRLVVQDELFIANYLFSLLVRFSWIRRIRCYWGLSYFPYWWDLV